MSGRLLAAALLALGAPAAAQDQTGAELWQRFEAPPDDARPMVRWWWFGPAVTDAEIDREIAAMKAGGFGGFEVQPTYPLSPDDPIAGIRNLSYLSPGFLSALRHAGERARTQGMRIDVTLGSGWPFGGPHVPVTQAAAEVRMRTVPLPAGAGDLALPAPGPGERRLALFVEGQRLALTDRPGAHLKLAAAPRPRMAQLFIAGRTGQQVKRAALGAEGFVLDHMNAAAVANHLTAVGEPLLSAFAGAPPPYAMFSDSLEVYGSSWTDDLPEQFRRRRGYDLLDHLPALFADTPDSDTVRFDWARTLSELVDERYLSPITAWAHAHGTRFRAQVYGFPPPTLSSNALVDLPEGEGADWRSFTSTRWASSAAHLYGRPVVSSETWTWLHSPAWAATPLDMKVEADRHFLQGVNQIVGHGWPYSPPGAPEPGWSFYAAAALNDHNPWYPAMPAVTRYLQRVSAMLRLGQPHADVALYLPIEDAFASMRPDHASVNEQMRSRLGDILARLLDAGESVDLIDAEAVKKGRLTARALVLPPMTRIDPDAYRRLSAWVRQGGILVETDTAPSLAGGLADGRAATAAVRAITARLLAARGLYHIVADRLSQDLPRLAPASVTLARINPAIGFVRRDLVGGTLYFVANTGPAPAELTARFAGDNGHGQWWDPVTGERTDAGAGEIALKLAPYQTRLLVFARDLPAPASGKPTTLVDLTDGWSARRLDDNSPAPLPGTSWTDAATLRSFSGRVRYTRDLPMKASPQPGEHLFLNFGAATPLALPTSPDRPRAALAAPVREAAVVRVNGREAGTVWTAPWQIDITHLLRSGANRIEVDVMNGAVNALSAQAATDRRLLVARYGDRFQDQDRDKLAPAPSGLLGAITLLSRR